LALSRNNLIKSFAKIGEAPLGLGIDFEQESIELARQLALQPPRQHTPPI
jgi:hypothetical protein